MRGDRRQRLLWWPLLHGRNCWLHSTSRQSQSQTLVDNRDFCQPHLHSTPPFPLAGSPSEYCYDVWYGKTTTVWISDCEIFLKTSLVTRFNTIHERDTQQDGRTDRRMDRWTPHDGIGRHYVALMHSIAPQKSDDCFSSQLFYWQFKQINKKTGELMTARGHMMPPPLHVWHQKHSENTIASVTYSI